jgi:hypothetical protein
MHFRASCVSRLDWQLLSRSLFVSNDARHERAERDCHKRNAHHRQIGHCHSFV